MPGRQRPAHHARMSKAHKAVKPDAPSEAPASPPDAPPAPEPLEARVASALTEVKALQADVTTACLEYSRALGHLDFALHWLNRRQKRLTGPKPAGPVWG